MAWQRLLRAMILKIVYKFTDRLQLMILSFLTGLFPKKSRHANLVPWQALIILNYSLTVPDELVVRHFSDPFLEKKRVKKQLIGLIALRCIQFFYIATSVTRSLQYF